MSKKIWIPKLNVYSRLSRFQENLWNDIMNAPFMGIVDNVTGLKFRKLVYNDVGPKRHFFTVSNGSCCDDCAARKRLMQNAVSSFPYGTVAAAAAVDSGLTTQIDRGSDAYDSDNDSPPNTCFAYGYNASPGNEDFLTSVGTMGSMDDDQYTDGGSTTRTIKAVYYTEPCSGSSTDDTFYFSIDGTSVPNTDTTWQDIDWDDTAGTPQTIDRSVNTTYTASLNGSSHWRWQNASFNWGDTDSNTDFVLTTS